MRNLDFSSWHALLSTLVRLAAITLIGGGEEHHKSHATGSLGRCPD